MTYTVRVFCFFFFNDTATTEIYTLSLHDALPIYNSKITCAFKQSIQSPYQAGYRYLTKRYTIRVQSGKRSEEHTSELQSRQYLVCRLLLEKKKKTKTNCMKTSTIKDRI